MGWGSPNSSCLRTQSASSPIQFAHQAWKPDPKTNPTGPASILAGLANTMDHRSME